MGSTMQLDLWVPAARDGTGRGTARGGASHGGAARDGAAGTGAAGAGAAGGGAAGSGAAGSGAAPQDAAGGGLRNGAPWTDVPRTEPAPRTGTRPPGRAACRGGARGAVRDRGAGPRRPGDRADAGPGVVPVPATAHGGPPPSRDALALLRQAAEQLAEAHRDPDPLHRYPAAYLAALRAGAAVLALRARPRSRRGAPRDVWRLLTEVAPELSEWAAFFASCSRTRVAAEAGIDRLVGRRDADDLLRQAEQFVARVGRLLPD